MNQVVALEIARVREIVSIVSKNLIKQKNLCFKNFSSIFCNGTYILLFLFLFSCAPFLTFILSFYFFQKTKHLPSGRQKYKNLRKSINKNITNFNSLFCFLYQKRNTFLWARWETIMGNSLLESTNQPTNPHACSLGAEEFNYRMKCVS